MHQSQSSNGKYEEVKSYEQKACQYLSINKTLIDRKQYVIDIIAYEAEGMLGICPHPI